MSARPTPSLNPRSAALMAFLTGKGATRSKYGNIKVERDGLKFDSVKEANRFATLVLLQRAGKISDLRRQVRYPLTVNGKLVTTYIADHVYREDGRDIVEDVKGYLTDEYRLKAKLFFALHGFAIREV